MIADDFVETSVGQKQIAKALQHIGKRRVTAEVKRCAVVVCNEDKEHPETLK